MSVSLRLAQTLRVCVSARKWGGGNVKPCLPFRFFLMYLINKDETEHTGQVRLKYFGFFFFHFQFLTHSVSSCFPALGVIRVEDVSRALLGLFPSWWLFQKAIRGSAFLADSYSCLECNPFISTENRNTNQISLLYNSFILFIQSRELQICPFLLWVPDEKPPASICKHCHIV